MLWTAAGKSVPSPVGFTSLLTLCVFCLRYQLTVCVNNVTARQLRRLLDTEKVMFDTDQRGHIRGLVLPNGQPAMSGDDWSYAVDITAEQDVVAPRGLSSPLVVHYNVVLEQLVLGGAPREAIKMGILLVAVLCFTLRHLIPRLRARLCSEIARLSVA